MTHTVICIITLIGMMPRWWCHGWCHGIARLLGSSNAALYDGGGGWQHATDLDKTSRTRIIASRVLSRFAAALASNSDGGDLLNYWIIALFTEQGERRLVVELFSNSMPPGNSGFCFVFVLFLKMPAWSLCTCYYLHARWSYYRSRFGSLLLWCACFFLTCDSQLIERY